MAVKTEKSAGTQLMCNPLISGLSKRSSCSSGVKATDSHPANLGSAVAGTMDMSQRRRQEGHPAKIDPAKVLPSRHVRALERGNLSLSLSILTAIFQVNLG